MDLITGFLLIFIGLLTAVLSGISILYPLIAGLLVFIILGYRRGFSLQDMLPMMGSGVRRTSKIYTITLMIGAASAGWMACGTVPYLILLGSGALSPRFFVVSIFLMTCLISLSLGSSFGTTGIIGVVFMAMARAGGVNPHLAAGALISAAYFGERSTPLSSCANLVAVLTGSDLYTNLKRLFAGTWLPFLTTIVLYTAFSVASPLHGNFAGTSTELHRLYNLSPFLAAPTAIIFIFVLLRLDVRLALLASMVVSLLSGVLIQHLPLGSLLYAMLNGFQRTATGPLSTVLVSGGLLGMVKAVLVVVTAAAYTGLFEGTNMLSALQGQVNLLTNKLGRFPAILTTALAGSCFGCSQTFAIMTAHQFMKPHYGRHEHEKNSFAEDLGNTAVVLAPLVPWNVASSLPAAVLATSAGYIPYAFYLYLIPLYMLWQKQSRPSSHLL